MSRRLTKVSDYFLTEQGSTCTMATIRMLRLDPIIFLADANGSVEVFSKPTSSPSARLIPNQSGEILSLEMIPDTTLVLLGNTRGSVFLFDLQTQRQIEVFSRHSAGVLSLKNIGKNAFVSGSMDTSVRVWDIRQKSEIMVLRGHAGAVTSVDSSPDELWVGSCSDDSTIRIWEISSAKMINMFSSPEQKSIQSLSFNPEEIQIAAGGAARKVSFYDLEKFQEIGSSSPTPGSVLLTSFDQSGSNLYAGGAGFLRCISRIKPFAMEVIEANWKIPQKIIFDQNNEILALGRQINGATLYRVETVDAQPTPSPQIAPTRKSQMENTDEVDEMDDVIQAKKMHEKIEDILEKKVNSLSSFVNIWLVQQNQRLAQSTIEKMTDSKLVTDIFSMLLENKMVQNLSVEFATLFLSKIQLLFEAKYKFCIKIGLTYAVEALRKFGQEIRSAKSVNLMTKVDLSRDERIKKYDTFLKEIEMIIKNSTFIKMRGQYKNEDIGQLGVTLVSEYDMLQSSIRPK